MLKDGDCDDYSKAIISEMSVELVRTQITDSYCTGRIAAAFGNII